MDRFDIDRNLVHTILTNLIEKGCKLALDDLVDIVNVVKEEVLFRYVDRLISQIESIIEINPSLGEKEILQSVAQNVVEFLGAEAASIRIHDSVREEMIAFGTYPVTEDAQEIAIPFEDTIAGEVVRTHRSYFVPNILKEEKYRNKEKVQIQGIQSMLAIPLSIPRFSLKDVDTEGVLQIYFKEKDKEFTSLEAKIAEVFARRASYVIAQKRILDLQKLNLTKDKIVEQIFLKLGRREGVKMKDVFNLVIPEMVDIMQIQRCALFSVMEDRQQVILEAGYPEFQHGIGKVLSVRVPYVHTIVNQTGPFGEFENEKIYPNYILIDHPQQSRLIPPDLKMLLDHQQIHSVLYVPLRVNDAVQYFLVFDAQAHHQRFRDEEIEIFTFFGKELMKGLRLEKMDDILHDFKNPAIAAAGFAKRVKKLLEDGDYPAKKEKIDQALNIILKETTRLQELALTLHLEGREGREEEVDLTKKLKMRFQINEEALKEMKRQNVRLVEHPLIAPLWVRCSPLHLERVLDNLFNNASNAIPEEGGELSIRSYRKEGWAVAEITNTGEIPAEDRDRYLVGDGKGRGIHITTGLVKRMGGKMEIDSGDNQTTFRVMFPVAKETADQKLQTVD
jgi:signal transduction histidine kinase